MSPPRPLSGAFVVIPGTWSLLLTAAVREGAVAWAVPSALALRNSGSSLPYSAAAGSNSKALRPGILLIAIRIISSNFLVTICIAVAFRYEGTCAALLSNGGSEAA